MNVFDSSAVLALLFDEPGAEAAARRMDESVALISTVNQVEVITRLIDQGSSPAHAVATFSALPLTVKALTTELALLAASLRPSTRALGLSLGDRCCLALARAHDVATVVTADRPWKKLKDFDVHLIR
jgi:ribonuclease VapC